GEVIVTAASVLEQGGAAGVVTVETVDGRSIRAIVLDRNVNHNIALISITEPITPLFLAREDQFMRNTPCLVLGFAIGRVNPEDQGELTDLTSWDQGISASGQAKLARGTWVLKFNASAH